MKRLISSLFSLLATMFILTATAFATSASGWKVDISVPANTTSKTFNVQYTTLSVGKDDDITVELFQNGGSVGSQTTTTDYGDSGAFSVTVPTVGTYSYYIAATNSTDPAPKTTDTVNVIVSDAPQPTVTTIYTNTGAGGQGAGTVTGTTTGGQGAGAISGDTNGDGVVDDQAASTEKDKKDVLGAETKKAGDGSKTSNWWYAGGLAVLLAAGYYYLVVKRANQN